MIPGFEFSLSWIGFLFLWDWIPTPRNVPSGFTSFTFSTVDGLPLLEYHTSSLSTPHTHHLLVLTGTATATGQAPESRAAVCRAYWLPHLDLPTSDSTSSTSAIVGFYSLIGLLFWDWIVGFSYGTGFCP